MDFRLMSTKSRLLVYTLSPAESAIAKVKNVHFNECVVGERTSASSLLA